jgi:hypothetical protein
MKRERQLKAWKSPPRVREQVLAEAAQRQLSNCPQDATLDKIHPIHLI